MHSVHLPALRVYSTPYEVWAIICLLPTCPPLHLVVLAALYQKKVIAQHYFQEWRENAQEMLCHIILDQCSKPSEDVATTADVLDMCGCKKEADMLRCRLGLSD